MGVLRVVDGRISVFGQHCVIRAATDSFATLLRSQKPFTVAYGVHPYRLGKEMRAQLDKHPRTRRSTEPLPTPSISHVNREPPDLDCSSGNHILRLPRMAAPRAMESLKDAQAGASVSSLAVPSSSRQGAAQLGGNFNADHHGPRTADRRPQTASRKIMAPSPRVRVN